MSHKHLFVLLAVLGLAGAAPAATPVTTAFTYQGALTSGHKSTNSVPISGITMDLVFTLWDDGTGGSQIGPANEVIVYMTNSLFTATLDFGAAAFSGEARWLEIGVWENYDGAPPELITLTPRQPLTATPYAVRAASASQVFATNITGDIRVFATNITGVISNAQLPLNLARLDADQVFSGLNTFNNQTLLANATGVFAGDGAGLTNLNASSIVGLLSPPTNAALLTADQTFTGSNLFGGITLMLNPANQFAGTFTGSFVGDGAGLTNIPNLAGSSNKPLVWTAVSGTAQGALPNNGYLAGNTNLVAITLPSNPSFGDVVRVAGQGAGGWELRQSTTNQIIFTRPLGCAGGLEWVSNGPPDVWRAIASSADGLKIVAVSKGPGNAYTSVNGGWTWTKHTSFQGMFEGVASSSDGTRLVAVDNTGHSVWTSVDSGATWTEHAGNQVWAGVASSTDGVKLIGVSKGGYIYTSGDAGANWTAHGLVAEWKCVACSADGVKAVAGVDGGRLYVSVNSGNSWTPRGPDTGSWAGVASSADGSHFVAVSRGGFIYVSVDGGVTWAERGQSRSWTGAASSADGLRLFAVEDGGDANGGHVYVSNNGGLTWRSHGPQIPWHCIAVSSDGGRVVAGASWAPDFGAPVPEGIYTSSQTTTRGTSGGLSGSSDEAVELLYMGNDQFRVLSHEGLLDAF